jgi:hypothetical protein
MTEGESFVAAVCADDAHRDPVGRMPVDALVRDVQPLPVAVEELPEPRGRAEPLGVRIGDVVGQRGHALAHTSKGARANSRIDCRRRPG